MLAGASAPPWLACLGYNIGSEVIDGVEGRRKVHLSEYTKPANTATNDGDFRGASQEANNCSSLYLYSSSSGLISFPEKHLA